MNRRNLEYVFERNPRSHFDLADDKVRAKDLLEGAGVPTPATLRVVAQRREIADSLTFLRSVPAFAAKPSRGFGGGGVLLARTGGNSWETSEGPLDAGDLAFYFASILAGMYSLDQATDVVVIEELLEEAPELAALHAGTGVSDVRVLLCDSSPVMAMLRLPCRGSGGTANLHRGGIGVGIDLASGQTRHAVRAGRPIREHPDSGLPLAGVRVPHWETILALTVGLNELFGLGYLGADVIVDERRGPLVVEVNARPGLTIQLANMRGLRSVLPGS